MASKVKRENTDFLNTIRPKRKDHPDSRGKKWIKQNEYDAICTHLNGFSDTKLADFIKKHKPEKMPGVGWRKGVTDYYPVQVPLLVDGGVVHWIAKAILQERTKPITGSERKASEKTTHAQIHSGVRPTRNTK